MEKEMDIDVWEELICPYCYIGRHRLETALARLEQPDDIRIRWHGYQLDPGAPRTYSQTLLEKIAVGHGLNAARAVEMQESVRRLAAAEGLVYNFEIARPGNTFDAHRIVALADAYGLREAATKTIQRAYFVDGAEIGDRATLVKLADSVGIDGATASYVLEGDAFADVVASDRQSALDLDVTGVPFFLFDGQSSLSGAQSVDALTRAIRLMSIDTHAVK
jgi:predicted DsbA family dithiol-disulfide isomerase